MTRGRLIRACPGRIGEAARRSSFPASARRESLVLLLLLVFVAMPAAFPATSLAHAGGPRTVPGMSAPERDLARNGWTIDAVLLSGAERPGMRRLTASGRIAAPAPLVWAAINNPGRHAGDLPSIKEAIVESVDAETTIARYRMAIPVFKDRRYRLQLVSDPGRMKLRFEMIPGYGNVRALRGHWKVTALGDSLSHLTYVVETDPGVAHVPRFLVDWATRKAVPRFYAAVYGRAVTGARQADIAARSARRRAPESQ
jgi:hypothetical protein